MKFFQISNYRFFNKKIPVKIIRVALCGIVLFWKTTAFSSLKSQNLLFRKWFAIKSFPIKDRNNFFTHLSKKSKMTSNTFYLKSLNSPWWNDGDILKSWPKLLKLLDILGSNVKAQQEPFFLKLKKQKGIRQHLSLSKFATWK